MTTITEEDALRLFPELCELVTIRRKGWTFRPVGNQEAGQFDGIVGSYTRPKYTDALWIYARTEVIGVRVLQAEYGGGTVWLKESGDLQEVVRELLDLPEPDERLAPTLVKPRLWAP